MSFKISCIVLLLFLFFSCGTKDTKIKKDIKLSIEEYKRIALSSYRKGDIDGALSYLNQSLDMAFKVDSVENITSINNMLADIYINVGDLPSASNCVFSAYKIEKLENDKASFETLLNIAKLWSKYYDKTQNSIYIEKSKEAFEIAEKSIKNEENKARYYNNYGKLMLRTKDYEGAIEFFLKALRLNESKKDFLLIADSYYNIGRVYEEKKQYEKAVESYKNSLSYDKLVENTWGIFFNLKKLGILYGKLNKKELSEYYLSKAKRIANILGDKRLIEEIEGL